MLRISCTKREVRVLSTAFNELFWVTQDNRRFGCSSEHSADRLEGLIIWTLVKVIRCVS